ncbi:IS66-like element accessory protein TnpA [Neorhizobium galegae]|uniref:IS66-like element accessory protein TnpA n=1 Tax=Neorhizobium galegae TaxID=399 RepID=UPI00062800AD|nr:transposase [Neorhizobium galegae]
MDDVSEARLLRVLRAGRGGKREFDPASKARLLEACLIPGVSISKLALENGINANLLRTWIRKQRQSKAPALVAPSAPAKVSTFIPVIEARAARIADGDRKPSGLSDPPMERRERSIIAAGDGAASGLRAKVSLPNGVTLSVKLDDASMIAAMIGALGNVPSVG